MKNLITRPILLATMVTVSVLVAGCLERKETIRVARDGAVDFELTYTGDPGDFTSGDAMPEEAGGWTIKDEIKQTEQKKTEKERQARLRVDAGKPLPASFATPGDRNRDTALAFPTEVKVEQRADGTYYHFHRVYKARENVRYDYLNREMKEDEKLKEIAGKNAEELTPDERGAMVAALRRVEGRKRAEYIATALSEAHLRWPQDVGLRLRRGMIEHFDNADVAPVVELLGESSTDSRDAKINEYAQRLVDQSREKMHAVLEDSHAPAAEQATFFAAYEKAEAARAVTEDLGDEHWAIRVELPGRIVEHNADKLDEGAAVWEFPGEALMDRDVVLMATSRVER
ncbi:MAG: hypothetical protein U1D55_03930 [Phycisphaerae bacterium]